MKEVYELDVYRLAEELSDNARGSFEETKAWLRKVIRRHVIGAADVQKYKVLHFGIDLMRLCA